MKPSFILIEQQKSKNDAAEQNLDETFGKKADLADELAAKNRTFTPPKIDLNKNELPSPTSQAQIQQKQKTIFNIKTLRKYDQKYNKVNQTNYFLTNEQNK